MNQRPNIRAKSIKLQEENKRKYSDLSLDFQDTKSTKLIKESWGNTKFIKIKSSALWKIPFRKGGGNQKKIFTKQKSDKIYQWSKEHNELLHNSMRRQLDFKIMGKRSGAPGWLSE